MMRQINLFNPALLPKKHHFSSSTMLQALAAILLGTIVVLGYGTARLAHLEKLVEGNTKQMAIQETQLKKITAEFTPRQKDPKLAQEVANVEAQWQNLQQLQNWLKVNTLGNTDGYAKPMAALARQSIEGLWLTGFDFGDAGQEVSLQGRAMQPALIPIYVQKLANEASFKGRAFNGLEIKQPFEPAQIPPNGEAIKFNPTAATNIAAPAAAATAAPEAVKTPYVEFSLRGAPGFSQKPNQNSANALEKSGAK